MSRQRNLLRRPTEYMHPDEVVVGQLWRRSVGSPKEKVASRIKRRLPDNDGVELENGQILDFGSLFEMWVCAEPLFDDS